MQQRALKVVIFDFDCTLTVAHVFASLAGVSSSCKPTLSIPPPYVRSELGQLLRLGDLENEEGWGPGVFAQRVFGSAERLAQLRALLQELRNEGISCMVCSRGMQGTLRKCLEQVNLLSYFSVTKGCCGASLGLSSYDMDLLHPGFNGEGDLFLDSTSFQPFDDKSAILSEWMQKLGLHSDEVLYIDDDCEEIRRVSNIITRTILVLGDGIGASEFLKIRRAMKGRTQDSSNISTITLPMKETQPVSMDGAPRAILTANGQHSPYGLMNVQSGSGGGVFDRPTESSGDLKHTYTRKDTDAKYDRNDSPSKFLANLLRSYKAAIPGRCSLEAPTSTQSPLIQRRRGIDSPEPPRLRERQPTNSAGVAVASGSTMLPLDRGNTLSSPSLHPLNSRANHSRLPEPFFSQRNDKSPLQHPYPEEIEFDPAVAQASPYLEERGASTSASHPIESPQEALDRRMSRSYSSDTRFLRARPERPEASPYRSPCLASRDPLQPRDTRFLRARPEQPEESSPHRSPCLASRDVLRPRSLCSRHQRENGYEHLEARSPILVSRDAGIPRTSSLGKTAGRKHLDATSPILASRDVGIPRTSTLEKAAGRKHGWEASADIQKNIENIPAMSRPGIPVENMQFFSR